MICRFVLVLVVALLSGVAGAIALVEAIRSKHGAHYCTLIVVTVVCDIALWVAIAFL